MKLGAIDSPVDVRDYRIKHSAVARAAYENEFPRTYKLKLGKVKNQFDICACVGFALSIVLEYHNDIDVELSTGYIYGNRRETSYKGKGMILRDALKMALTYGDCLQSEFPYNMEVDAIIKKFEKKVNSLFGDASKLHIAEFVKLKGEDEVKYYLTNFGPVIFVMHWYNDIKLDENGLMSSTYDENNSKGSHCMVIYGWDENGWLIRNSWGTKWGKGGNAILPFDAKIVEMYGVVDDVENTPVVKPFSTKIGRFFAKIFNFFANLFLRITNKKKAEE